MAVDVIKNREDNMACSAPQGTKKKLGKWKILTPWPLCKGEREVGLDTEHTE